MCAGDGPDLGSVTLLVSGLRDWSRERLRELLSALEQQTLQPQKLVFVVCGDASQFRDALGPMLGPSWTVPYEILSHGERGSCGALRNQVLSRCSTDYLVQLRSADLPKPQAVRSYAEYLLRNPSDAVVTSYLQTIDDPTQTLVSNTRRPVFRPIGAGLISGQIHNVLGHSSSAFRVPCLREIGGWDEAACPEDDDRSLFLKIASRGFQIGVIPDSLFLRRVSHEEGLGGSRTAAFERQLSRSNLGLPTFEAGRLQSVVMATQRTQQALQGARQAYEELHRTHRELQAQVASLRPSRKPEFQSQRPAPLHPVQAPTVGQREGGPRRRPRKTKLTRLIDASHRIAPRAVDELNRWRQEIGVGFTPPRAAPEAMSQSPEFVSAEPTGSWRSGVVTGRTRFQWLASCLAELSRRINPRRLIGRPTLLS
jgi:hypothetical protein